MPASAARCGRRAGIRLACARFGSDAVTPFPATRTWPGDDGSQQCKTVRTSDSRCGTIAPLSSRHDPMPTPPLACRHRIRNRHAARTAQNEKPLDPFGSRGFVFWRRGWDSNPRYGETVRLISSQVHSTTLPPLLPYCLRGWSFPREKDYKTSASRLTSPFCKFFARASKDPRYDACAGASIRSMPPMYGRSTSGTVTEPSAFW